LIGPRIVTHTTPCPPQQAYEVKHSLIEYLKATFRFKDKGVHHAFYNFITHPEEGIFKGPYVSLKLPFVTVGESASLSSTTAINISAAKGSR
jgi:hypothetical protein